MNLRKICSDFQMSAGNGGLAVSIAGSAVHNDCSGVEAQRAGVSRQELTLLDHQLIKHL